MDLLFKIIYKQPKLGEEYYKYKRYLKEYEDNFNDYVFRINNNKNHGNNDNNDEFRDTILSTKDKVKYLLISYKELIKIEFNIINRNKNDSRNGGLIKLVVGSTIIKPMNIILGGNQIPYLLIGTLFIVAGIIEILGSANIYNEMINDCEKTKKDIEILVAKFDNLKLDV